MSWSSKLAWQSMLSAPHDGTAIIAMVVPSIAEHACCPELELIWWDAVEKMWRDFAGDMLDRSGASWIGWTPAPDMPSDAWQAQHAYRVEQWREHAELVRERDTLKASQNLTDKVKAPV
jgi:hypothetical protein